MSGLAASFGIAQLADFRVVLQRQRAVVKRYQDVIGEAWPTSWKSPGTIGRPWEDEGQNGWGVIAEFRNANICRGVMDALDEAKIEYKRLFTPLHMQHSAVLGPTNGDFAGELDHHAIALPSSPSLSEKNGRSKTR